MGFIFNTTGKIGVERRSESIVLTQVYNELPPEVEPGFFAPEPSLRVEITKELLAEILSYFDVPEHRAECDIAVPVYNRGADTGT